MGKLKPKTKKGVVTVITIAENLCLLVNDYRRSHPKPKREKEVNKGINNVVREAFNSLVAKATELAGLGEASFCNLHVSCADSIRPYNTEMLRDNADAVVGLLCRAGFKHASCFVPGDVLDKSTEFHAWFNFSLPECKIEETEMISEPISAFPLLLDEAEAVKIAKILAREAKEWEERERKAAGHPRLVLSFGGCSSLPSNISR